MENMVFRPVARIRLIQFSLRVFHIRPFSRLSSYIFNIITYRLFSWHLIYIWAYKRSNAFLYTNTIHQMLSDRSAYALCVKKKIVNTRLQHLLQRSIFGHRVMGKVFGNSMLFVGGFSNDDESGFIRNLAFRNIIVGLLIFGEIWIIFFF